MNFATCKDRDYTYALAMDNKKDLLTAYAIYGFVGVQLAVSVVAGLLFGNYVDKKMGNTPWFTIIGLVIGSAAGFYNLFKLLEWREKK